MGSADIVPGVSGGTMALILGIYEELIFSLQIFSQKRFWQTLFKLDFKTLFELVNWRFFVAVLLGIGTAVLSLAHALELLALKFPVLLLSFFFGLIVASVVTVSQRVSAWNTKTIAGFVAGSLIAFLLVGLSPAATPESSWFIFMCGAIAICALILPGISGAFILVLLGKYQFVLSALNQRDLDVIVFFAAGALIGLLSFARFLAWLFKHYHDLAIATLCGFMLGSLRKVWPWKAYFHDGLSDVGPNILPVFTTQFALVIALALAGFFLVILIERGGAQKA